MKTESSIDYCAEQVRLYDHERFVSVLFTPYKFRMALWALYAFHIEIAKIYSVVTDRMTGLLRLQWWHEAIERLYQGKPDAHEVIRALELSLQMGVQWSAEELQAIIEAYENETPQDAMAQLLRLAHYVTGETYQESALLSIASAYQAKTLPPKVKSLSRTLKVFYWLAFYRSKEGKDRKPDYLLALRLWLRLLISR